MFWAGLAFLLGNLLFQQFSFLPHWAWLFLLAALTSCLSGLVPRGALLAWCLLGFGWGLGYAHFFLPGALPEECLHSPIQVSARVIGIPEYDGHRARFDAELNVPEDSACQVGKASLRARVSWYKTDQVPQTGELWKFTVKLRQTRNYYNDGGFDYEAYLLGLGIRHSATVTIGMRTGATAPGVRSGLANRIDQVLAERPGKGVVRALLIGDRSGLSDEQKLGFLRSGTLHLMAISGLHIGMIAGLGYFLTSLIWRLMPGLLLMVPAPVAAACGAVIFATFYAYLAGFTLPTQRALVMLLVVMLGIVSRRSSEPGAILGSALLVVQLIDPFSVNLPGFWLSFVAVGLLLFGVSKNVNASYLGQWSKAQLVLFVGLMPMSLFYFQGASLVAPIANLVAIHWVGLAVLPSAFAGVLLDLSGLPLGGLLLVFAANSMEWLMHVLNFLAHIPLAWLGLGAEAGVFLILAGLGVILLIAPTGKSQRLLGVMLMLPLLFGQRPAPAEGAFWFDMLDVGEGLAIVVRTKDYTLVYDAGPSFSSGFDTGQAVILPWLRRQGIRQIDTMMISHGDNDHIGGANSLLEGIPVSQVLSSVPERFESASECQGGSRWQWNGVRFEILHPPDPWPFDGNNGSCVLRVSNSSHSVLITGDIESMAEFRLRKAIPKLEADVLVVPHHGSRTSSSEAFIRAVAPRYALVSTGFRNRFGFPRPDITERYENLGVPVLNTAEEGGVRIQFPEDRGGGIPVGYLDAHRRYWYSAPSQGF